MYNYTIFPFCPDESYLYFEYTHELLSEWTEYFSTKISLHFEYIERAQRASEQHEQSPRFD